MSKIVFYGHKLLWNFFLMLCVCVYICIYTHTYIHNRYVHSHLCACVSFARKGWLTLILLTWRTRWAPNNARKWQTGFNSAFKGLRCNIGTTYISLDLLLFCLTVLLPLYLVSIPNSCNTYSCCFIHNFKLNAWIWHVIFKVQRRLLTLTSCQIEYLHFTRVKFEYEGLRSEVDWESVIEEPALTSNIEWMRAVFASRGPEPDNFLCEFQLICETLK